MYGGVRGRKTKVGEKLLCFPPTRFGSSQKHRKIEKMVCLWLPSGGKMSNFARNKENNICCL
jgi:hypothetical protein